MFLSINGLTNELTDCRKEVKCGYFTVRRGFNDHLILLLSIF